MRRNIFIGFMAAIFLLTVFSFAPQEAFGQPRKARRLVQDGDKFFQQKNYQSAIDKYAEAIVLAPNYPDAYFWKGTAHYYLDQYDQAIRDLSTALSQGYKNPLDVFKLRGYMNYQKQNYDAALTDATEVLKFEPSNITAAMAVADIYLIRKDWNNALTAYQRAAQINPQNGDISYSLAYIHSQTGNTEAQGTAAADAIKKGTRYTGEAYFLYGDAQLKARNSLEAMQAFERSVSSKPTIYATYGFLSEIYRAQGRFQDSINITLKGLENFPDDGTLYINLTWYYSLADKHREAVEAGKNAVKFAPGSATGFTNLCRAYIDVRQYGSAIEICNKALELAPNDGETHYYLGRAYAELKRDDNAKKHYAKAVTGLIDFTKANPDYSDGYYLLGNAYFSVGNREKAIESYLKCLDLSPRFAKARFNLGYIYHINGNKTAARQQYEELRKFDAVTAERLKQAMEQ